MLTTAKFLMEKLCRLIEFSLAFLLSAMTAVIFLQIFCRFVLNTGFAWSEELARYLFVWMCMLAASVAVYRKENLGISFFVEALPPSGRKACRLLVEVGCFVLFAHIVRYGYKILPIVGRQTSASLEINMVIPYFAVIVSATLMLVSTVISFIEILGEKEGAA